MCVQFICIPGSNIAWKALISSLLREEKFPLFKFGYLSEVSFTWLARPRAVLNVLLWRISLATTRTRALTAISEWKYSTSFQCSVEYLSMFVQNAPQQVSQVWRTSVQLVEWSGVLSAVRIIAGPTAR